METLEAKLVVLFSMFSISFLSGVFAIKLVDVIKKRRRLVHTRCSLAVDTFRNNAENVVVTYANEDHVVSSKSDSYSLLASATPLTISDDVSHQEVGSGSTANTVLSLLNCFAGGVFLATSLLHLLPDVREDIDKVLAAIDHQSLDFPLAEFFTSIGLFVVMVIEQIVLMCQKSPAQATEETRILSTDVSSTADVDNVLTHSTEAAKLLHRSTSLSQSMVKQSADQVFDSLDKHHHHKPQHQQLAAQYTKASCANGGTAYGSIGPAAGGNDGSGIHSTLQMVEQPLAADQLSADESDLVHSTRSSILLMALSIHTVFEGLAIGLQDSTTGVWLLFAAISLHKVIVAFTSGLRFAETLSTTRRAVIYVIIMAAMSPVGIGIGTAVSESGANETVTSAASAVMQGLATGTFFYVTFFEVLNEQLGHIGQGHGDCNEQGQEGIIKVLAVAVGFGLITLLELLTGDS